MPVWHEATKALRKSGKLSVIGITQEQHPDRCRLFAQWKGLDWPILWDPFNMTGSRVVPRFLLVDENGVVRSLRANKQALDAFLAESYPPGDAKDAPTGVGKKLVQVLTSEKGSLEHKYYAALSDLLWNTGNGDKAMLALEKYVLAHAKDAAGEWRWGVAFRMRHDSAERHDGDFAAALSHWQRGLDLDRSHYIYRRRLQQYGPRLSQPYPFYSWVEEARAALKARGVVPPTLAAPLTGAEAPNREPSKNAPPEEPDPKGEIEAVKDLLDVESVVAWGGGRSKHGAAARVHVTIRPAGKRVMLWDAEAGPVTIWLRLPAGWTTGANPVVVPLTGSDPAEELVEFDFEVGLPDDAVTADTIKAYALYYACLDGPGECRYLRRDFEINVQPKR